MRIEEFCDMDEFQRLLTNWSGVSGFEVQALAPDGRRLFDDDRNISLTHARYNKDFKLSLEDDSHVAKITCFLMEKSETEATKEEFDANVEILESLLTYFVRNEYSRNVNAKELADIKEKLKSLSGFMDEADANTKKIASFAGKQRILALNASIEAARVGEAGKGFAVVANEVQKLALGMDQASTEITGSLKDASGAIHELLDN